MNEWNFVPETREYVAEARKLQPEAGVGLEGRILARLRQYATLSSDEALLAAAEVVREQYTPEEKTAFAA